MKKKMSVGGIIFLVGLVIAIVVAIMTARSVPVWAVYVLGILGLLVGLLNITEGEATSFLLASLTFLLSFQALSNVIQRLAFGWEAVGTFFSLLSIFIAPAAAVVAVKVLLALAKD